MEPCSKPGCWRFGVKQYDGACGIHAPKEKRHCALCSSTVVRGYGWWRAERVPMCSRHLQRFQRYGDPEVCHVDRGQPTTLEQAS